MSRGNQIFLLLAAFILTSAVSVTAQVNSQNRSTMNVNNRSADNPGPVVYGGYQIGVGDVLDIHVNDEDDISGRYQVDQDGKVKISLLPNAIQAAGSTTFEFARRMSDELKQNQILREPSVTVLILRELTQNVSVMGAVMRPGVYPLEKPTGLMDVISAAGGLAPNAGNTLTVTHHVEASAPGAVSSNGSATLNAEPPASIDLTALLSGRDRSASLVLRAGDVITVNTAPVVFVVGSVGKPGAFAVQDRRSQMTDLQAVAMAEGPTPTASLGRSIIIRKSQSDSERVEIPIDLKKVMRGKEKDQILEANDILFIPQSGLKAGMRRLGDIGAQAAVSAVTYSAFF